LVQRGQINWFLHIYGKLWINAKRQKTGENSRIPLLPVPKVILDRYIDHPECSYSGCALPVKSNQKTNLYLKELAKLCNIEKNLTFHIARHTFATTITLSNGVPIETISKMLGHTSIKTTQIYAKVLDNKISEDMAQLEQKIT